MPLARLLSLAPLAWLLPAAALAQATVVLENTSWLTGMQHLQVQPDGTTYVTSTETQLLIRSPSGELTPMPLGNLFSRFVVAPDGTAYAIRNFNQVREVQTDGTNVGIATGTLGGWEDIGRASDGTLYVTDVEDDEVVRVELAGSQTVILDATGDGLGNTLGRPQAVVVAPDETVYVAAATTNNVFRIDPGGTVTEILDATGDGLGNTLSQPWDLALDATGRLYVVGSGSDNLFRVDPGGAVTELLDATGDGLGNTLNRPRSLEVEADGTAYVAGQQSDNLFQVLPAGTVTEIMDATGAGVGSELEEPAAVDVDGSGDVYVLSAANDLVLRWDGSTVTQHMNASAQPHGQILSLITPLAPAFGPGCEIYVAGAGSDNVFCVEHDGTATELSGVSADIEIAVDGAGNLYAASGGSVQKRTPAGVVTLPLVSSGIRDIALDPGSDALFVAARDADTVHRIDPSGSVSVAIDATGDGLGNALDEPWALLVEPSGSLLVLGRASDNVFRVEPGGTITELVDATGDGLGNSFEAPRFVARGSDGSVYVSADGGAGVGDRIFAIRPGGLVEVVVDLSALSGVSNTVQGFGVSPTDTIFVGTLESLVRRPSGGPDEVAATFVFPDPANVSDPPRQLFAFRGPHLWFQHESTALFKPDRISLSTDEGDTSTLLLEQDSFFGADGFHALVLGPTGRAYVAGTRARGVVWRLDDGFAPIVPLLPAALYLACGALLLATRVRRWR